MLRSRKSQQPWQSFQQGEEGKMMLRREREKAISTLIPRNLVELRNEG
jgi:hypothetical protein